MKIYIKSAVIPVSQEPDDIRRELAKSSEASEDTLTELSSDPDWRIRRYATNSSNMPVEHLQKMATSKDAKVRREAALSVRTPVEILETLVNDRAPRVRLALAENPNTTLDMLEKLVLDKDAYVRRAAIVHPNAKPLVSKLYNSEDNVIRRAIGYSANTNPEILTKLAEIEPAIVAGNPSTPVEVLRKLSKTKSQDILSLLANNHSTPADVLNRISDLDIDEYPGLWYHLINNPNTPKRVLQKLTKCGYHGLEYAARNRLSELTHG